MMAEKERLQRLMATMVSSDEHKGTSEKLKAAEKAREQYKNELSKIQRDLRATEHQLEQVNKQNASLQQRNRNLADDLQAADTFSGATQIDRLEKEVHRLEALNTCLVGSTEISWHSKRLDEQHIKNLNQEIANLKASNRQLTQDFEQLRGTMSFRR